MFRKPLLPITSFAKSNRYTDHLLRYNPIYYDKARSVFDSHQSDADLSTDTLLDRVLDWAQETSYGQRIAADGNTWPILAKALVRDTPNDFRAKLIFSVPASTGGSSGQPLMLWRSPENIAAEQAFLDWLLSKYCPPMRHARVAVLRADHIKDPNDRNPPFGEYRNRQKRLVLSSSHMAPDTICWFHNALSKFKPELLWVSPTSLASLLSLLTSKQLSLKIPVILSGSEVMPTILRAHAETLLESAVIDAYGQSERVCAAYSESPGSYRFHPHYGRVELIPTGKTANKIDGQLAKIIATGFWNRAMPFVRYDTGDYAILPKDSKPADWSDIETGRKSFCGILGRKHEYIIDPNGNKILALSHIPRETKDVLRIQIVQNSFDKVQILALCRGHLGAEDRHRLISNAREIVPDIIDIEINEVQSLITLPNGKTPLIIRNC